MYPVVFTHCESYRVQGRSWLISAVVRNGSPIWPSGHHRRALSLRLHPSAEHDPAGPICVTRRAILGFHSARLLDPQGRLYAAPSETRLLAATYPEPIRAWIERNGGLTENPIFLRSR